MVVPAARHRLIRLAPDDDVALTATRLPAGTAAAVPAGVADRAVVLAGGVQVGERISTRLLRVASGELTRSEELQYGDCEFVPWQLGSVMCGGAAPPLRLDDPDRADHRHRAGVRGVVDGSPR